VSTVQAILERSTKARAAQERLRVTVLIFRRPLSFKRKPNIKESRLAGTTQYPKAKEAQGVESFGHRHLMLMLAGQACVGKPGDATVSMLAPDWLPYTARGLRLSRAWCEGMLVALLGLSLSGPVLPLDWDAPEGCPQLDVVEEEFQRLMLDPDTKYPPGFWAKGELRWEGSQWVLEMNYHSQGSPDSWDWVSSPDCHEMGTLAAGSLAFQVDPLISGWGPKILPKPSVQQPEHPSKPSEPEEAEAGPLPGPEPSVPRSPPADGSGSASRLGGVMALAGGAAFNLFPSIPGGVDLRGGISLAWARVLAVSKYWAGGRFFSSDRQVGAELQAWSLGIEGCGAPLQRRLEVQLCLEVSAGGVRARGFGSLVSPRPVHRAWVWTGARSQVAWALSPRVSVFGTLGLGVSVYSPRFEFEQVQNTTLEYSVPRVQGVALAGLELKFGPSLRAKLDLKTRAASGKGPQARPSPTGSR